MTAGSAPLCRRCGVVVGHRPIRGQGVNAQLDCGPFPAVVLRRMPRIKQDTKIEALKNSPLFEGLSRKQLTNIARLTDDLDVPAGTVLCEQGRRGHEFFVITEGEATVTRGGKAVATVGAGDFFGEIALLENVVRTATVTAATPLRFFVVSDRAFNSVLETDPTIERKVLRALARRLVSVSGDPETA
jgi:CRP/FNR family transcriptional regulator, cyclic AMP receptor protein